MRIYFVSFNNTNGFRYKKENLIVLGCCNFSPDFSLFLKTLVNDFITLDLGIIIDNTLYAGKLVWTTMDIDAKTKFQNLGGPHSFFGCFYCLIQGEYCYNPR